MEGAGARRVRPRRDEVGAAGESKEKLAEAEADEELRAAAAAAEEDRLAEKLRAAAAADKLTKDLHEEFLVRLSPQQPKLLFRFAAVNRSWRRILADAGFISRYRDRHSAAPQMLGCIYDDRGARNRFRFITTTAAPFAPRFPIDGLELNVIESRHGRVLFRNSRRHMPEAFVVWDPLTGVYTDVPLPEAFAFLSAGGYTWSAALLCDAAGPCIHSNCHDGPFRVILVLMKSDGLNGETSVFIYTSRTSSWATPTSTRNPAFAAGHNIEKQASTLVDSHLFFRTSGRTVVRYQIGGGEGDGGRLSFLQAPVFNIERTRGSFLVPAAGGKIRFVAIFLGRLQWIKIWEMEAGAEEPVLWERKYPVRVREPSLKLVGFAEATGEILVGTNTAEGPIVMNLDTEEYRPLMGVRNFDHGVFVPDPAMRRYRNSTDSLVAVMGWYTPRPRALAQ